MLMATLIIALATSCSHQKKYVIGVAQCSEDSWRHKLNAELQAAAYFHPNVELRFANATTTCSCSAASYCSLPATAST